MPNPLRAVAFCFFLALASAAADGQTSADAKVGAVHLKGLKRFTEAQVLPVIDIPSGSPFDPSRLDAATQALGATGAFEEVRYSYRPEGGAVSVDFFLKETSRFRRCTFDNFPFSTADEIQSYIHSRVPLYDGTAPDSGSILDEVSAAFESFAKSRGISATIERISHGALGGADLEYLFRLRGPTIKISRVGFSGTRSIPESELVQEAKPLAGRDYSVVGCREFARTVFLPYYRERGFLKAKVGESSARPIERQQGRDAYEIQVEFPVTEGSVYVWDGAQWQGNHFLPADQLTALLALKPGDVASDKKN